ncbi:MAG: prealbumin-like fold domain-containing protein [Oscillospiraceae bacterium]|nr:prealbumin-like fold domain-containing protein [Oscillospiraceae bacterium]
MNCNQSTCQTAQAKTVCFRVLDQEGRPVCGALFELAIENEDGNGPFKLALSDKNGCANFCGVLPGNYLLTVVQPPYGYEPLEDDVVESYPVYVNYKGVRINNLPSKCFVVALQKNQLVPEGLQPPLVNEVSIDALTISGYDADACCCIEIRFPNCCCVSTKVLRDGSWIANIPQNVTLTDGDEIDVVQSCQGRRSRRAVVIVGDGIIEDDDNGIVGAGNDYDELYNGIVVV